MKKLDFLTLIAISIISWSVVNITHETLGHAGFGLLSGFKIKAVNTTTAYLDVDWDSEISQNGFLKLRLFLIGGVLLNFITGIIALIILFYCRSIKVHGRLFLWLFASFSYVVVVMNLVTAPLTGGGDFAEIIRTYDNQLLVRLIILITGIIIMILGYFFLQRIFIPYSKGSRNIRSYLTIIPVATTVVIQSLSIVRSPFANLPPDQNHLLASVFAYMHLIIWSLFVIFFPFPDNKNTIDNTFLPRSISWIIAGTIVALFYLFILGPGIGSFDGHPMLPIN
jgi:hypothetical protein